MKLSSEERERDILMRTLIINGEDEGGRCCWLLMLTVDGYKQKSKSKLDRFHKMFIISNCQVKDLET